MAGGSSISCPIIILPGSRWPARCSSRWDSRAGKIAWFFLNLELLFLTGFVLRDAVPGVPRSIALVAVPLFLFSVVALLAGQTTILILFLAARGLESCWTADRDRAAGVCSPA